MQFYVYRIDFVTGHYYYGYHKGSGVGDCYFGSPTTHKEMWLTVMHSKSILGRYETKQEAWKAETEFIRPVLNEPMCLNEHCGGYISSESCKKGHQTQKECGVGIYAPGAQRRSFEVCSKAGKAGAMPWWNNGVKNTRSNECPGKGWVPGRLVGWKWYNDGKVNVRSNTGCPEGCQPGRIMRRNASGKFA